MRRLLSLLTVLVLVAGTARAQQYSGTFTAVNPQGQTVTVILQQGPEGRVTGNISNGDITLALEGTVTDDVIEGTASGNGAKLFFEAEIDGNDLYLFLMDVDAQGNPNYENGQEMELKATSQSGRLVAAGGGAAAVDAMAAPTPAGANPLGAAQPAAANPLAAAADPVSGTYSDGSITVVLQGAQGEYQGRITTGQEQWPVAVHQQPNGMLSGQFQTEAGQFPVAMAVQGSALVMETGGQTYQLQKQGAPAAGPGNPVTQPANPAPQPGMGGATGQGGISDGTALGNEWAQWLAGKKVTYMESYTSGTAGGYNMRTDVYLCSSGEFLNKDQSAVSVDVGGAFGNAGGNSSNTGRWRIITQGQLAGIELKYNDGRVEQYQLQYQNGATYADGTRVYVTAAEICQ